MTKKVCVMFLFILAPFSITDHRGNYLEGLAKISKVQSHLTKIAMELSDLWIFFFRKLKAWKHQNRKHNISQQLFMHCTYFHTNN